MHPARNTLYPSTPLPSPVNSRWWLSHWTSCEDMPTGALGRITVWELATYSYCCSVCQMLDVSSCDYELTLLQPCVPSMTYVIFCAILYYKVIFKYILCLTVYRRDILFCWRSVFIQATRECYIQLESVWRGVSKSVGSVVRLSLFVCPFVTLTKKSTPPLLLTVEK